MRLVPFHSPLHRIAVVIATAALLFWGAAEPSAQQPTFRAGATLVRVDVTVANRNGEPVTDLTAADFEVEEDGVVQTVEACRLVSANGLPASGDNVSLAIRSRAHAAAEAARDDVRLFLIFWDEYHISQFGNTLSARQAISRFVATAFGPTDLVALMDPLLPVDAIEFTRDHAALAERIRRLPGRLGLYMPTRSAAEEAMLESRDVARLRTEVTMSALKSAAVHLGGLKEGRKSIVFISEGFVPRMGGIQQLQDVIQSANDSNTAIYTLDPRGLSMGVSDVLRMLADNTGAEAIVNSNQPTAALRQVIRDSSAFYYIGYAPTRTPVDDGRFHQIRVRVKRSGVAVRARRGYWAPSVEDLARAERDVAATDIPADAVKALAVLESSRPDQKLDFWVGTSRASDGSPTVNLAWTPKAAQARPKPDAAGGAIAGTIAVTAQGADGKRVLESSMAAGRMAFPARPGALQLSITTRDTAGEVVQEDSRALTVPEFPASRLALSSPVLFRAKNVVEFRSLAADADPLPHAGFEFVRTDRLLIRFTVYGDPASTVSARLLSRDRKTLVTIPATRLPDGTYQLDLPLASIARGDFLVAIEASLDDERATALVPLRVVS